MTIFKGRRIMKERIIIPVALVSCLVCASCKAVDKAEIPDLKGDMSISGSVTCDGVTAQAEFTRSAGIWTVCYTSPDTVNGLTVIDDGNTVKYSLDGIEYEYSNFSPQFATAAGLLTDCIDNAGTAENVTARQGDDKLTLSGTADKNSYTLTLDNDGKITGISVGGYVLDCSGNPTPETTAPTVDVGKYLK